MGLQKNEQRTFATIISDATIRVQTQETNPDAVKRDYETSDGKTGTKYELVYNSISGIIEGIEIQDGNYGKNLNITIDGITLSLGASTQFGEDFAKKLPNVDLTKEVKLVPFSFDNERGKTLKGITIYQGDNKLDNFFWDKEKKEALNGCPEPEGDTKKFDSDDWKMHFTKVRKFVLAHIEEVVIPKLITKAFIDESTKSATDNVDEVVVDEVPFD